MRELELLQLCDHPNIIEVYTGKHVQERFYMFMELMDLSADKLIFNTTKYSDESYRAAVPVLLCGVANALQYLHSGLVTFGYKAVAHLDTKPQNILLRSLESGELEVKLGDFGASKLENSNCRTSHQSCVTTQRCSHARSCKLEDTLQRP